MAGRREVRCVGPSYPLADRKASAQRSVNLYLSAIEGQGEDKQFILRGCHGVAVTDLIAIATDSLRGMAGSIDGSRLYVIDGAYFWNYDAATGSGSGSAVLSTASGDIRMATGVTSAGIEATVIVDGEHGYVSQDGGSPQIFSDAADGWRGSTQVEYLDGYFIFVATDDDLSEQFYICTADTLFSIDALDFSSADRLPDPIIAARVCRQQLYLFGSRSTEIWVNSGDADFPFARYNSAPSDVGIVGKKAVIKTSDSLFMVGLTERGQAAVYSLAGNLPKRVSTRAVEETLLAAGAGLANCRMWTYQTAGAEFVGIEVPGARATWVYDLATQQWHERCRLNPADGQLDRMHIVDIITLGGRHFVAFTTGDDDQTGGVYVMSDATQWVNEPLIRERTWPHLISPSAEMVRYASLELMRSTGSGGTVTLEISNDGGNTWGTELPRSLGATGRFMQRVRWNFLGQARDRVFRIRCSDDVAFNIHGAQLEAA